MPAFECSSLILTNFWLQDHFPLKKSTILHLRFPFSFFLLPVFLLACGISTTVNIQNLLLSFIILHFLVYPASNGYNSFFDKDEESIGGLKHPPKVTKELYWIALLLDFIALGLSLLISFEFALMVLVYGTISKAYSHPSIRLKKYPIMGWLAAGIFQGYFTYLLSYIAINDVSVSSTFSLALQAPGVLSSLLLLGSYPMTQVYQHEEDAKRGDRTISRALGVLGTFHFTAIAFTISSTGFFYYFLQFQDLFTATAFLLFLSPVLLYFISWYIKVRKHRSAADFDSTMKLNLISSSLLNGFFLYLWVF